MTMQISVNSFETCKFLHKNYLCYFFKMSYIVDNQQFIEAINFLKVYKKVSAQQVADLLGVKRHVVDNIKRGQGNADERMVSELVAEFPEISQLIVKF